MYCNTKETCFPLFFDSSVPPLLWILKSLLDVSLCVCVDPGLVHYPAGKNKRMSILCVPLLVLGLVCCLFSGAPQSEDPARL